MKKMTLAQMRKALKGLSREEMLSHLEGIYRACPDAAGYLMIRLGGEEYEREILAEARDAVRAGFFTKRGKARLDLPAAKDAVQRYGGIFADPGHALELKLYYVEDGMEVIEHYRNIPDKLYSAVEGMFRNVVKELNEAADPEEGRALAERYRARLTGIAEASGAEDPWFHGVMKRHFQEIRWFREEEPGGGLDGTGAAAGSGGRAAASGADGLAVSGADASAASGTTWPEPVPIGDAADVLPEAEAELFYGIFFPLLDFVNEKRHVNGLKELGGQEGMNPAEVRDIAKALWDEPSLIDEYLEERGGALPAEHCAVLSGWKRRVKGRFVVERYLKRGAVLVSIEDRRVYLVRGIKISFEEMLYYRPLPVMMSAVLIPYKGVIISDGLNGVLNLYMGAGMKAEFKEIYMGAKRRGEVCAAL